MRSACKRRSTRSLPRSRRRLKEKRKDWSARHILFPQVLDDRLAVSGRAGASSWIRIHRWKRSPLLRYKQHIVERLTAADRAGHGGGGAASLARDRAVSSHWLHIRSPLPHCAPLRGDDQKPHQPCRAGCSHVGALGGVSVGADAGSDCLRPQRPSGLHHPLRMDSGVRHEYRPDYLIRWRCKDGREVKIILEVKGFETEQDRQKETAARRWVPGSQPPRRVRAGGSSVSAGDPARRRKSDPVRQWVVLTSRSGRRSPAEGRRGLTTWPQTCDPKETGPQTAQSLRPRKTGVSVVNGTNVRTAIRLTPGCFGKQPSLRQHVRFSVFPR